MDLQGRSPDCSTPQARSGISPERRLPTSAPASRFGPESKDSENSINGWWNSTTSAPGARNLEDVVAPSREVEIEPSGQDVVPVAVVACGPHQVAQVD
jgi:hypothetical protein